MCHFSYKHAIDGLFRIYKEEGATKLFSGATMASSRAILVTIGQVCKRHSVFRVVHWVEGMIRSCVFLRFLCRLETGVGQTGTGRHWVVSRSCVWFSQFCSIHSLLLSMPLWCVTCTHVYVPHQRDELLLLRCFFERQDAASIIAEHRKNTWLCWSRIQTSHDNQLR